MLWQNLLKNDVNNKRTLTRLKREVLIKTCIFQIHVCMCIIMCGDEQSIHT